MNIWGVFHIDSRPPCGVCRICRQFYRFKMLVKILTLFKLTFCLWFFFSLSLARFIIHSIFTLCVYLCFRIHLHHILWLIFAWDQKIFSMSSFYFSHLHVLYYHFCMLSVLAAIWLIKLLYSSSPPLLPSFPYFLIEHAIMLMKMILEYMENLSRKRSERVKNHPK